MKTLSRALTLIGLALGLAGVASAADAPTCEVCNMAVDAKHNVQYRYVLESDEKVAIGSLTCAKAYWSEHRDDELAFEATDFVTGDWRTADDGFFLVGSKLKLGTGMDKASVVFFADAAMANKAKAVNGGTILKLPKALARAAGDPSR